MTHAEKIHLQFVLRHAPEPSRCEHDSIEFVWPDETDWSNAFQDPDDFDWSFMQSRKGRLSRVLFTLNGRCKFWAWSLDGKTPLFPEVD